MLEGEVTKRTADALGDGDASAMGQLSLEDQFARMLAETESPARRREGRNVGVDATATGPRDPDSTELQASTVHAPGGALTASRESSLAANSPRVEARVTGVPPRQQCRLPQYRMNKVRLQVGQNKDVLSLLYGSTTAPVAKTPNQAASLGGQSHGGATSRTKPSTSPGRRCPASLK